MEYFGFGFTPKYCGKNALVGVFLWKTSSLNLAAYFDKFCTLETFSHIWKVIFQVDNGNIEIFAFSKEKRNL
jgi:hypothetical protein